MTNDWLAAASDPRVVAVVLARDVLIMQRGASEAAKETPVTSRYFRTALSQHGISATEDQARALLDAVAAWDADQARGQDDDLREMFRDNLEDAVTAIVGEQPHLLRHEGMGNYTCRVDGTPTGGWPCPNGPDRVPMDPATGMPLEVGEQP